jgi:hypothetical protein
MLEYVKTITEKTTVFALLGVMFAFGILIGGVFENELLTGASLFGFVLTGLGKILNE